MHHSVIKQRNFFLNEIQVQPDAFASDFCEDRAEVNPILVLLFLFFLYK